jgi:sugar transferase (PEP-CTERM/EpsH1 system associated)
MKILWAKIDFLHPTNRGGQIRTLEMLRRLHQRHEVHYIAYDDPASPEGRKRACEYSTKSFPVNRPVPPRGSPAFAAQLVSNIASPLPLAVGRYRSAEMQRKIRSLIAAHKYDAIVADFLSITPNFESLDEVVLFQHNVESSIWKRHASHASSPARRIYFGSQARRMEKFERATCRAVRQVISVSQEDSQTMQEWFGVDRICHVPTGVDTDFFRPPDSATARSGIVFVGAMDWLPNIDGARWFVSDVLPLIRAERPNFEVTFAGRNPKPDIRDLGANDPRIRITGTVPDVRPYLWGAAVSIVPLRIGGGTRLKIYESMAAGAPVVSTTVGAEGLDVSDGRDILLADNPKAFAAAVLQLLREPADREQIAVSARELVAQRFSWEKVTDRFESILERSRPR